MKQEKAETADMAHDFNHTLKLLRELEGQIKKQTEMIYGIGNDIISDLTETDAAINMIASNIRSTEPKVINRTASVTKTATATVDNYN